MERKWTQESHSLSSRERYQWRDREKSMTQQEMPDNVVTEEFSSIFILSGEWKKEKIVRD